MFRTHAADRVRPGREVARSPSYSGVGGPASLLRIQMLAGNRAVTQLISRGVPSLQRCGANKDCGCSPAEKAEAALEEDQSDLAQLQRRDEGAPDGVILQRKIDCKTTEETDKVKAAVAGAKAMADAAITRRGDARVPDIAFLMFRTRDAKVIDGVFARIGKAAAALGNYDWDCQDGSRFTRGCGKPDEYAASPFVGTAVNVCDRFFTVNPAKQAHICLHESMHFGAGIQSMGGTENYLNDECLRENSDVNASVADRLGNADHHACFARLLASGTDVAAQARGAKGDDLNLIAIDDRRVQLRGADYIAQSSPQKFEWAADRGAPIAHSEPLVNSSRIEPAETTD